MTLLKTFIFSLIPKKRLQDPLLKIAVTLL